MSKKAALSFPSPQEADQESINDATTPKQIDKVSKMFPFSDLKHGQGKVPHQYQIKLEDQQKHTTSQEHNQLYPELDADLDKKPESLDPIPFEGGSSAPGETSQKPIFLFSGGSGDWPGVGVPIQTPDKKTIGPEGRAFIKVEQEKSSTQGTSEKMQKFRSPFDFPKLLPVDNFSPTLSSPNPFSFPSFSLGSCPSPISNKHSNQSGGLFSLDATSKTTSASPKIKTEVSVQLQPEAEKIEKRFEEKLVPETTSSPPLPFANSDSWNVALSHSERLGMLFETGVMGDFWVRLGHVRRDKPSSRSLKVHKAIISANSQVFGEMIRRAESDGVDFIVVKDNEVRWEAFRAFLKYFYTGSIDMQGMQPVSHIQNLFEIYNLATEFCVIDLKENCERILESKYLDQNPVEIMQRASECCSFLENIAMKYILRNAVDILESEEFLKLTARELCKIFESNDLVVFDEKQVFSNLLRWGASQCPQDTVDASELRRVIQEPLRFVRFSIMKVQDFVSEVVEKDILSSDQVVEIMKTFVPGRRQSSRDYISQDTVLGFNRFSSRKAISVFRPSDVPDLIKFRVNAPIRLLAVGVIAESDDGHGLFEITVTVEDENLKPMASATKTCSSSDECHSISFKAPAGLRLYEDVWYTISGYVTQLDDENHKILFGVDKNKSEFVFDYTKTEGAIVHKKKLHFTMDNKEDLMCGRNFGGFGILDEIYFLAR